MSLIIKISEQHNFRSIKVVIESDKIEDIPEEKIIFDENPQIKFKTIAKIEVRTGSVIRLIAIVSALSSGLYYIAQIF